MPAPKRYAPTTQTEPAARTPVVMVFVRNKIEEDHEFLTVTRADYQDTVSLFRMSKENGRISSLVLTMDRMIRKAMDDDDGTPHWWRPEIDEDGNFIGPTGETYPESDLAQFSAFAAGSSRRRWCYLMDEDHEVSIENDQIADLFRDIVEGAGERPTKR